jgi:hypothetical protein
MSKMHTKEQLVLLTGNVLEMAGASSSSDKDILMAYIELMAGFKGYLSEIRPAVGKAIGIVEGSLYKVVESNPTKDAT